MNKFKVKISNCYMLSIFALLALLCVLFFIFLPIDSPEYVTSDSIHYKDLSLSHCEQPLLPISDVIFNYNIIGLNWVTIVSLGALACNVSLKHSDTIILVFNLFSTLLISFISSCNLII